MTGPCREQRRGVPSGLLLAFLLTLLPGAGCRAEAEDEPGFDAVPTETRIGVPALCGKERALRQWQATAGYLSNAIPGRRFVVVPLEAGAEELEGRAFGRRIAIDGQSEILILRDDGPPGVAAVSVTETVRKGEHARLAEIHDITERKAREEIIRHLAFRDGLSDLPNRSLVTDPDRGARAQATVAMAHGMGRTLIATGVETPDQLRHLAALGCDAVQGYPRGRPAPPDEPVRSLPGQGT